MWHEYPIQSNFERQKEIIRGLRAFIERLETDNIIVGYCFDHYFSIPDVPDELRIRFQYSTEDNRTQVENLLQIEVRRFLVDYTVQEREWGTDTTDRHVLQAYEFGSRCAFLAWRLVENGRFRELLFSNAIAGQNENGSWRFNQVPLEFQIHFNHGVMNSLGVCKVPTEQLIHLNHLMDSSGCHTKQALIEYIQRVLP